MSDMWSNAIYQKDLSEIGISDNVWTKLYGKKILVTGATGMVCSFLVDVLMKRNEMLYGDEKISLIIVVRNVEYAKRRFLNHTDKPCFKIIGLDVISFQNELDDFMIDYMIIGAGCADPRHFYENPVGTMQSNLFGLTNFLEIAKSNRNIRVLYLSTGEIYGNAVATKESFKETDSYYVDSMAVRSCYPNSKRAAETFCAAYHKQYGIDVVVARLCYVYGATFKDSDSRSVVQFLKNAARREDIILKSKGEQIRSYCYIGDVVSALLFLLVHAVGGEAYNIANADSNCSIAEFAAMVARTAGVKCVYETATEQEKDGYSRVIRAVQCSDKINALGWKAKVTLESGVERTLKILWR